MIGLSASGRVWRCARPLWCSAYTRIPHTKTQHPSFGFRIPRYVHHIQVTGYRFPLGIGSSNLRGGWNIGGVSVFLLVYHGQVSCSCSCLGEEEEMDIRRGKGTNWLVNGRRRMLVDDA